MRSKIKIQITVLLGIMMSFTFSPQASAWGRFGVGPLGVHASTHGGIGVSLPTPQISAGTGGPYDVTATADPNGVRADVSGRVSGGVSSDGDFYGGVSEELPGSASVSGWVDEEGISGDVTVDDPLEPTFYTGEI